MASLGFFGNLRMPYPDHGHGFWGKQTSTLNFCEEVSRLLTEEVAGTTLTWPRITPCLSTVQKQSMWDNASITRMHARCMENPPGSLNQADEVRRLLPMPFSCGWASRGFETVSSRDMTPFSYSPLWDTSLWELAQYHSTWHWSVSVDSINCTHHQLY